jgi:DNA-binding response OmpR family regulator
LLKGARVLVAEDEVLIALEIQSILEESGAETVWLAHTLDEALAQARDGDFTSAVLDARLGSDSVDPVARVLQVRGIPFVFYSGQDRSEFPLAEWRDMVVLSKPASAHQLRHAVADLVRRRIAVEA